MYRLQAQLDDGLLTLEATLAHTWTTTGWAVGLSKAFRTDTESMRMHSEQNPFDWFQDATLRLDGLGSTL
jgi:hypothetical protein